MFDESENVSPKSKDIPCPAYEVCAKLGTAMDSCTMINKLIGSAFTLQPYVLPDLHNLEGLREDPETPDTVAEEYQQALAHREETTATQSTIEIRRIYNKLNHMQCCLSSIALLLANKPKS